jgi:hypothetical protein
MRRLVAAGRAVDAVLMDIVAISKTYSPSEENGMPPGQGGSGGTDGD